MLQVSKIFRKHTHYLLQYLPLFFCHTNLFYLLSELRKKNEHQGITKYLCDIMFKMVYARFNLKRQCIASNHRASF